MERLPHDDLVHMYGFSSNVNSMMYGFQATKSYNMRIIYCIFRSLLDQNLCTDASIGVRFCFRDSSLVKPPFFPGPFSFIPDGTCTSKAAVAAVVASFLTWMVSRQGHIACERGGRNNQFLQGWFAYFGLKFPQFNRGTGEVVIDVSKGFWYSQPLKIKQVNQPSPLWENTRKHTWSLKLKVCHH